MLVQYHNKKQRIVLQGYMYYINLTPNAKTVLEDKK